MNITRVTRMGPGCTIDTDTGRYGNWPGKRLFTAVAVDPFGMTVWWEAPISQGEKARPPRQTKAVIGKRPDESSQGTST
jgi:hypothetical protein